MILLLLVLFNDCNFLSINIELLLLISDQVTQLHLFLDKILCLGERTDELLPFFTLHGVDFGLVAYIDSLEVLLLVLELDLFVTQLFPQALFFLIQVQKYLNVSIKLSLLFSLDDLFDFSLLNNILSLFILDSFDLFFNFNFDFSF